MAKKKKTKTKSPKQIETLLHEDASRKNIPTAEYQSVMAKGDQSPVTVTYPQAAGSEDALAKEKAERNRDLDPQLIWRGKREGDLSVQAPPLFIQEKIHPKVLIDDLRRRTQKAQQQEETDEAPLLFSDLYADFNGLPDDDAKTEFYQHDANWTNRMILGDSLQVMASLAEREGLRGQVQCIYIDPPYGIKFNSNFQWSTTSRDVKDGNVDHITREPEQVKAFRDTWRDGIHSYLTYLRERLTVARDLLTESGSIFVQIGDENVHRVRSILDEVFGEHNFCSLIQYKKTTGAGSPAIGTNVLAAVNDFIVWYAKNREVVKYRQLYREKDAGEKGALSYNRIQSPDGIEVRSIRATEDYDRDFSERGWHLVASGDMTSQTGVESTRVPVHLYGEMYRPSKGGWKTNQDGIDRLKLSSRLTKGGKALRYVRRLLDFAAIPVNNEWSDTGTGSFTEEKVYIVQSGTKAVQRCLLMVSDPGDLILDPTCGSGTAAAVAEQWGRRWITIDTSRVALALARSRVMGARYPYYVLADSKEGVQKEAEITRCDLPAEFENRAYRNNVRQGFVYERVPHITLKSIANNTEIDVIWERMQPAVEQALADLNATLAGHKIPFQVTTGGRAGKSIDFTAKPGKTVKLLSGEDAPANAFLEWEVPREPEGPWDADSAKSHAVFMAEAAESPKSPTKKMRDALTVINENLKRDYTHETLPERPADPWPEEAIEAHAKFWAARIARQKEIDASIAAKAEFEYLYDKPYEDKKKVRVAGPFTVESISPHRSLGVDENDELIDPARSPARSDEGTDFAQVILENLKTAGVQQAHKEDKINFTSIAPWPGTYICAEGRYAEGDEESGAEKRAGIFIGPEFGTVDRQDLVRAAREAGDAGFDVLIACAFSYGAHASEFSKLGAIPVLKARMNADLHMADDLKNTGKGNLFVIFGEPDIEILPPEDAPDGATIEECEQIRVKINGVDVFHPQTGEIRSDGAEGIACWFIDTDYNEESFFVRHAYFLGANDPYKSLKTTLKAEIDEDAWATLNSDTSRPFAKPKSGRIAVKVINHLGDEVMKVFGVE
ncbi:MAG TPA: site-specific DNA-methyltransferase [Phycisphaerae bacterium]|nr:site-specific DNA-methyltransferase [Phycisphaerae bacterium]HRW52649.1 site-specific DNA-methyltransferase [Phycisphaerae bacterium]